MELIFWPPTFDTSPEATILPCLIASTASDVVPIFHFLWRLSLYYYEAYTVAENYYTGIFLNLNL